MCTRTVRALIFTVPFILALLIPALLYADGGIYFEDILCKRDGRVAVNSSFDNGPRGWKLGPDSIITPPDKPFPSPTLYVDCHGKTRAADTYPVNMRDAGVVELHSYIYLPKVTEQAGYGRFISFAYLGIWPTTRGWNMYFGPKLYPKDDGYRIGILWNNGSPKAPEAVTEKAVLKPETWALLSFYLDRTTGVASVYLDQKLQTSLEFDPDGFARIDSIGIQSWLGDRRDLPADKR